jgi:cell wall assembly regulator SMI1
VDVSEAYIPPDQTVTVSNTSGGAHQARVRLAVEVLRRAFPEQLHTSIFTDHDGRLALDAARQKDRSLPDVDETATVSTRS